jgi:hypothetical protein
LHLAGSNGDKIASKYRDKGLRVVAIDIEGSQKGASQAKWKSVGADFYLYDKDMNCLQPFYKSAGGYPYCVAIKDGVIVANNVRSEAQVTSAFGF